MSNPSNTPKSKVNRTTITRQKVGDRVNTLDAVCAAGATSAPVTASTVASAALAGLKTKNLALRASLVSRDALLVSYRAQCKVVGGATASLDKAASTYMGSVDNLAAGDATVITGAGLPARLELKAVAVAATPLKLRSALGKQSKEAVVQWAAAPGASAYKLRANFTPADPTKWEELSSGGSRRRVVTAPAAAAQFLVSVASIGSTSTSDWSDPVMATAR